MMKEKLGYRETARRFEVRGAQQIIIWERIYLAEGPEALDIERRCRGRGSSGRPRKLPKEGEEDLLAEVQRLRAENEYLKNLQALVLEDERRQHKNAGSSETKTKIFSQSSAFNRSTASRNVLLSFETNAENRQIRVC